MGEAKKKMNKAFLSAEVRAAMLGADPFKAAYDLIYGMIETVYSQTGGVNHELIGLEFEAGRAVGINVVLIKRTEEVPDLRDRMLVSWPMVVHVCEAWAAPDASRAPHAHPQRQDVVAVTLHTLEFAATANCPVNEKARTIQRGELLMPTAMKGRLGRDIATRPLSS